MKITRFCTLVLICLPASLFQLSMLTHALSGLAIDEESSDPITKPFPPHYGEVRYEQGYLTIKVQHTPVEELLGEIARQSGLSVVSHVPLEEKVTLEFQKLSMEQGLQRVLGDRSFALGYAPQKPNEQLSADSNPVTLWILKQEEATRDSMIEAANHEKHEESEEEAAEDISILQETLSSEEVSTREKAVEGLGESGNKEAVVPLGLALTDRNEDVREAAIDALAEIGGDEAASTLAIALDDKNPDIREEAVDALGEIGGQVAIELLERALHDNDESVREAAAEVLEELKNPSP